jgi:hypothetical protein
MSKFVKTEGLYPYRSSRVVNIVAILAAIAVPI